MTVSYYIIAFWEKKKLHSKESFYCEKLLVLHLQGPGGVWCEVDVVEFAYYGTPEATPTEQLYTELVDGLGGNDPCIGSGSQVFVKPEYNKSSTYYA